MKLEVHIKDKVFSVHCGDAKQRVQWIADASVIRYEHFSGGQCNEPLAIRKEDGTQLNFDSIIKDVLEDGADVWVLFKEDLEALGLIAKGKKRASEQQKNSNTQFSP